MVKQAEFYKGLSGAIRTAKTDWYGLWLLFGLSFAYGVFHAAGPGHGKAVISSYVIANRETWWRGVVLSFASAMVQATVAVVLVGIAAVLLNATAATMKTTVYWIEIVSYLLIIAIGLRLVWAKGRAMLSTWRDIRTPKTVGAAATPAHLRDDHAHHDHAHHDHAHHDHGHDHAHGHDHHPDHAAHAQHDHAHHDHAHHAHGHDHHDHAHCGHDHGSAWSHAHAPEPSELAGPGGWKRGLTAIFAVGLRPCSGAILVLVFTLAQGLFWAGVLATFVMGLGTAIMVAAIAVLSVMATSWAERVASTRGGYGMLFMRGLEVAAALLDHRVRHAAADGLHGQRAAAGLVQASRRRRPVSRLEAEQPEEVRRIDEDLLRVAEPGLAAELAPDGCGLGEVAGRDVVPDLRPFRRRQHAPQGLVGAQEAGQERIAVLIGPARRLVEQEDPAGADGAADRLHQAQLVVGRQVMDRQAAPGRVGMLRPAHHGLDEIAVVEVDLERHAGEIGGGKLERRLRQVDAVIVADFGAAPTPPSSRWRRRRRCRGS